MERTATSFRPEHLDKMSLFETIEDRFDEMMVAGEEEVTQKVIANVELSRENVSIPYHEQPFLLP